MTTIMQEGFDSLQLRRTRMRVRAVSRRPPRVSPGVRMRCSSHPVVPCPLFSVLISCLRVRIARGSSPPFFSQTLAISRTTTTASARSGRQNIESDCSTHTVRHSLSRGPRCALSAEEFVVALPDTEPQAFQSRRVDLRRRRTHRDCERRTRSPPMGQKERPKSGGEELKDHRDRT